MYCNPLIGVLRSLTMKRRRSLTGPEQVSTLEVFISRRKWTQKRFVDFLDSKGITITTAYLNDVLKNRRAAGPKFKQVFREITGIQLVDGLIEKDKA